MLQTTRSGMSSLHQIRKWRLWTLQLQIVDVKPLYLRWTVSLICISTSLLLKYLLLYMFKGQTTGNFRMNLWSHRFSQNTNKNLLRFLPSLHDRVKILTIFPSYFGRNDNFIKSSWNCLTFIYFQKKLFAPFEFLEFSMSFRICLSRISVAPSLRIFNISSSKWFLFLKFNHLDLRSCGKDWGPIFYFFYVCSVCSSQMVFTAFVSRFFCKIVVVTSVSRARGRSRRLSQFPEILFFGKIITFESRNFIVNRDSETLCSLIFQISLMSQNGK